MTRIALAVLAATALGQRQIGNPRGDLTTSLFLRASDVELPATDEERKSSGPLLRVTLPA